MGLKMYIATCLFFNSECVRYYFNCEFQQFHNIADKLEMLKQTFSAIFLVINYDKLQFGKDN